jgi:hypothetical protein
MARVTKLINAFGKMAGWNSVTYNLFGRDVEGIVELSYDDNVDKEMMYGAGRMPLGVGEGNYSASTGLKLYKEEVVAIQDSIRGTGKRLQDLPPTDVVVMYEYEGRLVTDIIRNFEILKIGKSVKQNDKTVDQTVECICSHIDWNV